MTTQDADFNSTDQQDCIHASGQWVIGHLGKIETKLKPTVSNAGDHLTVDMTSVEHFDSAGALLVQKLIHMAEKQKIQVELIGLNKKFAQLLAIMAKEMDYSHTIKNRKMPNEFYMFGQWIVGKLGIFMALFAFFGEMIAAFGHAIRHPHYLSWRSILAVFHANCYKAMPIAGLLTFLVGIVLAFQMIAELASYGMQLFIVNISSLLVLREFGPLMTAIVAAGRTSTAFSAQIGTMIVNDEIDALKTMGIRPMELLVIPKIIGVAIALPLLTVWADIFGMFGSMLTAKVVAGISFYEFIDRFHQVVPLRYIVIGLCKTPIFAVLITMVGCYQGFQSEKNANSVGRRTTLSAVQALFLIIIADVMSSVIFSWDI